MSNRGIGRARMFVGGFLLFAAVIVWGTGILTSPHGETVAQGTEHVRSVVVTYLRNSALATVFLAAVSAFLLFPARRPRAPRRDWAIGLLIAVLIATSLYQLLWLQTAVVS
ncbi:MAG TPA: hypothetical protein VHN55_09200 [Sphingomicrobium sp.]|nr:hypothetical protein [Sphingomicrobium sp.]